MSWGILIESLDKRIRDQNTEIEELKRLFQELKEIQRERFDKVWEAIQDLRRPGDNE